MSKDTPPSMTGEEERAALSAWAARRPARTEGQRAAIARARSAHLPQYPAGKPLSDEDLNAMKAAFIRRFDEDLPRTETLMATAPIGYRMAMRDVSEWLRNVVALKAWQLWSDELTVEMARDMASAIERGDHHLNKDT